VYFLLSFTIVDASGSHTEPGGRFRLLDKSLKDSGHWSWHSREATRHWGGHNRSSRAKS
jgi:hypothetical protein